MRWIIFVGIAVGTVASFWAPPLDKFQNPDLARMIFFHLPCALLTSVFVMIQPYFSFRALRAREDARRWDARALACGEMAVLYGALTLMTGILFSKVQWGAWWSNDPRQTSFLFVMMILAAYLILREALPPGERRVRVAAAYSVFATLPTLFLIFVLPRIMFSLHPDVVRHGGFDRTYATIFLGMMLTMSLLAARVYRMRMRVEERIWNKEVRDAELDLGGDAAASRVVRPVSIHAEDRA